MISFSVASPTSFSYGHQVSFPSLISSQLLFSSRKLFYSVRKDAVGRFQAFKSRTIHGVPACAVSTSAKHIDESGARTQPLRTVDTLSLTKEISIFDLPLATYDVESSRKERNPKRLGNTAAQNEMSHDYEVIKCVLRTEAAIKAITEFNTLMFIVDKRADKKVIRDTVTTTFMVKAKKVNTAIMPDGRKKAFVMLAPECNAVDVAKRFKIL